METRSRSAKRPPGEDFAVVAGAPDDRSSAHHSRAPSPAHSVASSCSSATTIRRQRLLEAQLAKCEQMADIDRKLLEEKYRLQTAAIIAMDDDEIFTAHNSPAAAAAADTTGTAAPTAPTRSDASRGAEYDGRSPAAPAGHACCSSADIGKFLARQTSIKELPTFSGDVEEWTMFYSQFVSTTQLCKYSDDENIARLVKCLKGKARDAVSALLVSASSLGKIIDTLKLRFGRADCIIETMLVKIRAMHNIRHDDINALIEFATSVQNVEAAMRATDEIGHLTNTTLIREIVSKLPSILKYQWSFYIAERGLKHVTLTDLSEWLMKTANAATHVAPMTPKPTERPNKPWRPTVLVTTTAKVTVPPCVVCNDAHSLAKCPEFVRFTPDDRWKLVTEKKFCFSCLSPRHQLKDCRRKKKCTKCDRLHHDLLHTELMTDSGSSDTKTVGHVNRPGDSVMLKVARVVISGPGGDVETLAMLDEGANVTLIDEGLAQRIGVKGAASDLRIQGVSSMTSTATASQCVSFSIRGVKCTNVYSVNNVRTVNNLSLPVYNCSFRKLFCKYDFLNDFVNNIEMTDIHDRPLLLIGHDNIDLIVTRQLYQTHDHAPFVSLTRLGYIVHGRLTAATPDDATVLHVCACEDLNDAIRRSLSTEGFGVKPSSDSPRSREDMRALAIMEETTKLVGDRWETGLLWKDNNPVLPDSYPMARRRLDGIVKKMQKLPEFAARYEDKIKENLEKGYISKLSEEDRAVKTGKTWVLPHFAVFNPNKPNKLRIVFDCAAKSMGKSLNDFLLSGPDFLTSLPSVLLAFRTHRLAVIGDIQEMFHRVLIREEDRQAQRILWVDGEYVMNVMTFGAVCSPSSAQYVKNLNARRFETSNPRAVAAIVDHHYVDDFIYSVDSLDSAIEVVDAVIGIHAAGGFNMRNFMSNSKELLRHLPEDKLAPGGVKLLTDSKDDQLERVLGVNWDPDTDDFQFALKFNKIDDDIKTGSRRPTKREVLRLIMSVFDPLGFLLYITVKARILLQDIWRSKIGWDDEIESSVFERWLVWLKELHHVRTIKIPRWLMTEDCAEEGPTELHVFCDASSKAFASVAYLRRRLTDGTWHVALMMARARVAPLKTLSIPRLEFQAAVMGARLSQGLRRNADTSFDKTVLWSDSKTVLSWIRSDTGRFKPFVAHRVSEIAELTDVCDWRWVPTGMNAADDATRDTFIDNNQRWLKGPEFLRLPEESWHKENDDVQLDPDDVEVKATCLLTIDSSQDLLDVGKFSHYWRLVRSMAWLYRFISNARSTQGRTGELTTEELQRAEIHLQRESQRRSFPEDIASLRQIDFVAKDSRLRQLTPFIDADGLLRVGGRIERANVDENTRHPKILHPKDGYTKLLIDQYHRDSAHIGRETVLNNLKKQFWILNGRNAVKSAWSVCQTCRNNRAKPRPPLMGQLPDVRVTVAGRAFAYTGLDYFGPMTVKVGRRQEKRWGVLFTCLTIRAVHVDLVSDLTTNSAIMAIRRFIARRGCPEQMWSDNATTFRGADRELRQAVSSIDRDELLRFGSIRGMEWKFICPNSPHMAGCWERMVRSIKTALKATLRTRVPSEHTLITLLAEAEAMVNSRPLTYVPLDHVDDRPLTPNDFLFPTTGDNTTTATCGTFTDGDLLRRTWRESQRLADLTWKRWVKEYLPTLTRRDKWYRTTAALAEGDVVVVADDQLPRNLWPRGVITKTYPGRDGQVRVADVRTVHGLYKRPATKLCKLEVTTPAA